MPYLVRPYFAADAVGMELEAATAAWQQLAGRLPERGAAMQILTDEAERAYAGATSARPDLQEQLESWTWSEPAQAAVPHRLLARDAAAVVAARHYGDLVRLQPEVEPFRQRELISRLHVDQALGGLDEPLRRARAPPMNWRETPEPLSCRQRWPRACGTAIRRRPRGLPRCWGSWVIAACWRRRLIRPHR